MRASGAWVSIRVHPGSNRDAVLAALFESGAQGVQELDDNLLTHVQGEPAAEALICAILAASPDARVDSVPLVDVDWAETWKRNVRVQNVGNLIIAPPWLADEFDGARTIVIEPAMAFGTGDHASTRGVMRLMQSVVHAGDRVADLGAGSAVLSIAAAKLGARYAAAVEIDADAIGNAQENVRRSGAGEQVVVIEGDAGRLLPLVAPVRVVLANIISSVLVELLPVIASALEADGRAILGGMLVSERQEMIDAFTSAGWRVENEDSEDGWWSTTIARR